MSYMVLMNSDNIRERNKEYHFSSEDTKDLCFAIAENMDEDFFKVFKEFYKLKEQNEEETINTYDYIINSYNCIMKMNEIAFEKSLNSKIIEFITSNNYYNLDYETCGEIKSLIAKTEIGNKEMTNLPTLYKFFKRFYDKQYSMTRLSSDKHFELLREYCREQEYS